MASAPSQKQVDYLDRLARELGERDVWDYLGGRMGFSRSKAQKKADSVDVSGAITAAQAQIASRKGARPGTVDSEGCLLLPRPATQGAGFSGTEWVQLSAELAERVRGMEGVEWEWVAMERRSLKEAGDPKPLVAALAAWQGRAAPPPVPAAPLTALEVIDRVIEMTRQPAGCALGVVEIDYQREEVVRRAVSR